jgi:two-component system, sensor histidine kinase PdtaS
MRLIEAVRRLRGGPVIGLAAALVVFLAAFLLRYSLGNNEFYNLPFITFFPAILISALIGGLAVGVVVAILSALASWFWFLPPSATTALHWPEGYLTWALFVLTCLIQLYVINALNKTVDELSLARDRSVALFQELQHRVANNLQFVAAMLRMKHRALEVDPAAGGRLFESAQTRLDTMARIHRQLYSPDRIDLPIAEFFERLCSDILTARGAQNVKCMVKAPQVAFDLQRLNALGLLVNELVTNAVKHAFTDGEAGTISITLEQDGANQFTLTVRDNGCGLPPGLDVANSSSLGLRIMQGLAAQLGGKIRCSKQQQGTAVRLTFPIAPPSNQI